MNKFNLEIKDSKVIGSYDGNADGEKSASISLDLKEILGEVLSKGEAKLDVKSLSVKMELTKLKIQFDSDKDGEPVGEIVLDFAEAFDEAVKK